MSLICFGNVLCLCPQPVIASKKALCVSYSRSAINPPHSSATSILNPLALLKAALCSPRGAGSPRSSVVLPSPKAVHSISPTPTNGLSRPSLHPVMEEFYLPCILTAVLTFHVKTPDRHQSEGATGYLISILDRGCMFEPPFLFFLSFGRVFRCQVGVAQVT